MVLNETSSQTDGLNGSEIDSGDSYSISQNSVSSLRQFSARIEIPPYGPGKQLLYLRPQPAYEEYMASQIKQHIEIGMAFVNRPLTQQETDSFVDQAVSLSIRPRVGTYLGTFVGFLIVAKPFFKNGRLIPVSKMIGLVNKSLIMRTLLWPFFIVAGSTFGKVGAASLAVLDLKTDPRLAQYRKDRAIQDPQKVQKNLEKFRWKTLRVQPNSLPNSSQTVRGQDDASLTEIFESTGYTDSQSSSTQYGSSNESNGIYSQGDSQISEQPNSRQWDSPQQQQQQQQQRQPSHWGIYREGGQTESGIQSTNRNDTEDVFDLNSSSTPTTTSSTTSSQSSGSAWDRLRTSSKTSTTASNNRNGSTFNSPPTNDQDTSSDIPSEPSGSAWDRIRSSSTFPSSNPFQTQSEQWPQNRKDNYVESTQQQKDKAQQEFDRLLEKERQTAGDGDGYNKQSGIWGRES
ncbi:hypothetical protein PAAG_05214 [Paracoccidioides lutzii Pb01]|uniref:Endo-1,3(4)-beta-glucanase n=1 Tax=Paracoccidioides lutzii (strain ATCC MYA-826 / Pb01) TaxID=502779 RepID=C1H371_PARBA|nr:hypothetical protein PAAG_05214 [Paracoccidioides lutzii Pb01]EEH34165.1 hypothetical protein PAAG_05214 [Paracoccidioides lutzii Pb01]